MIFRQLFEPVSSTYTYLLGCEESGRAVLIDPVINSIDRDLQVLQQLNLTLAYTVDTHIHADHITAAHHLKERVGSKIAAPAIDRLSCVDLGVEEGSRFRWDRSRWMGCTRQATPTATLPIGSVSVCFRAMRS